MLLDLSFNAIGFKGIAALGELSRHSPLLLEINLSHNRLGDECVAALIDALRGSGGLECLERLDIGYNALTARTDSRGHF